MIDIILKGIVGNTDKIETIARHVIENERKNSLMFSCILVGGYFMVKTINKQDQKIRLLEEKIKDIKTKGE